jgi:hypothetical protein
MWTRPPRTLKAPTGVWFSCLSQVSQRASLAQQRPGVLRRGRHGGVDDALRPLEVRARHHQCLSTSIWIGPSARPWTNWSTWALPLRIDLVGLALPDDPALVDHGDVVGDLAGRRHVVGDRDGGGAEALDAVDDEIVDDVGHDRVEAGRRLVEEDDLGVRGDGAGEADALLHAARQLGREQLGDVGAEAHLLELVERDVLGLVARHLAALDQAEGDVLPDRKGCRTGPRPGTACRSARDGGRAPCPQPTTSSPPMRIEPESGRMRPRIDLIITDLPVPEPPITTIEWPRAP